jgi:ribosomal-protein-alanine N-acetyltransferase
LPYYIRPMRPADVSQVNAIDREAFPTQWPSPNYDRELKDAISHHIVAADGSLTSAPAQPRPSDSRLWDRIKRWFNHKPADVQSVASEAVLGFASLWIMADEAHLTNIAVRPDHRRQGVGDLLMISVVELAQELKADYLTLEVRVSNTAAQLLYQKYGFADVGRRKGYYTDNREDALIMSTESMKRLSFQQRLKELKEAYQQKSGQLNDLTEWNHNQFISAKPPSSPLSR